MKTAQEVKAIRAMFTPLANVNSKQPDKVTEWAKRSYVAAVREILRKNTGTALWMVATALHAAVDAMKQEMMNSPEPLENDDSRSLKHLIKIDKGISALIKLDTKTNTFSDNGVKADEIQWETALAETIYDAMGFSVRNMGQEHKRRLRKLRWTEGFTIQGLERFHNLFEVTCEDIPDNVPIPEILDIYLENIPDTLSDRIMRSDYPFLARRSNKDSFFQELMESTLEALRNESLEMTAQDPLNARTQTAVPRRGRGRQSHRQPTGGDDHSEGDSEEHQLPLIDPWDAVVNAFFEAKPCAICHGRHDQSICWSLEAQNSRIPKILRFWRASRDTIREACHAGAGPHLRDTMTRGLVYERDNQTPYKIEATDLAGFTELVRDLPDKCDNPKCAIKQDAKGWKRQQLRSGSETECQMMTALMKLIVSTCQTDKNAKEIDTKSSINILRRIFTETENDDEVYVCDEREDRSNRQ